ALRRGQDVAAPVEETPREILAVRLDHDRLRAFEDEGEEILVSGGDKAGDQPPRSTDAQLDDLVLPLIGDLVDHHRNATGRLSGPRDGRQDEGERQGEPEHTNGIGLREHGRSPPGPKAPKTFELSAVASSADRLVEAFSSASSGTNGGLCGFGGKGGGKLAGDVME